MPENKLFLLLYILLNMELSTVEQMAPSADAAVDVIHTAEWTSSSATTDVQSTMYSPTLRWDSRYWELHGQHDHLLCSKAAINGCLDSMSGFHIKMFTLYYSVMIIQ
jgi:hypothetical protein